MNLEYLLVLSRIAIPIIAVTASYWQLKKERAGLQQATFTPAEKRVIVLLIVAALLSSGTEAIDGILKNNQNAKTALQTSQTTQKLDSTVHLSIALVDSESRMTGRVEKLLEDQSASSRMLAQQLTFVDSISRSVDRIIYPFQLPFLSITLSISPDSIPSIIGVDANGKLLWSRKARDGEILWNKNLEIGDPRFEPFDNDEANAYLKSPGFSLSFSNGSFERSIGYNVQLGFHRVRLVQIEYKNGMLNIIYQADSAFDEMSYGHISGYNDLSGSSIFLQCKFHSSKPVHRQHHLADVYLGFPPNLWNGIDLPGAKFKIGEASFDNEGFNAGWGNYDWSAIMPTVRHK